MKEFICLETFLGLSDLPGLLFKNIGEKVEKMFQKCRTNIEKYIQKIGKM